MPRQSPQVPPIALVIDDDPGLCDVLTEAFVEFGYKVLALSSPPDHDVVRRLAPDLVVLDLMFQGRPQGCEFARRLKNDPGTESTPVLAISASSRTDVLAQAEMSANAVLLKPFDLDSLNDAATHAIQARPRNGRSAVSAN